MIRRIRLLFELTCEAFSRLDWCMSALLLTAAIGWSCLAAFDGRGELAGTRFVLAFVLWFVHWGGLVAVFTINALTKTARHARQTNRELIRNIKICAGSHDLDTVAESALVLIASLRAAKDGRDGAEETWS